MIPAFLRPPCASRWAACWGSILMIAGALGGGACSSDEPQGSVAPRPAAISGVVQKGPFVRGTRVTVQELDATLSPNGRTFEVETTDDLGAFTIPVALTSRFVEVIATGFYYNEFRDQLSQAQLTLRTVSDVTTDGNVDVNLLTSICAPLIRDLVGRGRTFGDAKSQTELAVLDALGFARPGVASFDKLDVASPGSCNAVLLAGSLILEKYAQSLGDSEVAELTQLLSQIGAALSNGGTSAVALANLRAARCRNRGRDRRSFDPRESDRALRSVRRDRQHPAIRRLHRRLQRLPRCREV